MSRETLLFLLGFVTGGVPWMLLGAVIWGDRDKP